MIAATSKRTSSEAASGWAWSHAPAARRTRRRFSPVDCARRTAVRLPGPLLDLDEHEPVAATHDQVELVAACAEVRTDDSVAASR